MVLLARLTCVALLAPAGAIQIQLQRGGTAASAIEVDCHTAVEGETCYDKVEWLRKNFQNQPGEWPALSESSTFEEIQAVIHDDVRLPGSCPKPCSGEVPCRTAVEGDACFKEVQFAMNTGISEHPEWFPELTKDSTFEDFQAKLHSSHAHADKCAKPCQAARPEERPAECHTAIPGEKCHNQVFWAMVHGITEHPEWYPGLSHDSTFEQFQSHLHGKEATSGHDCPAPCEAQQKVSAEAAAAEAAASEEKSSHEAAEAPSAEAPASQEAAEEEVTTTVQETLPAYADEDTPPEFNKLPALDRKALAPGVITETGPTWASPTTQHVTKKKVHHGAPRMPEARGCYSYMPTGCPYHQYTTQRNKGKWVADWKNGRGDNEAACFAQKALLDEWCGTSNIQVIWIPPPAPQMPSKKGCYVWLPGGCAKKGVSIVKDVWKHDEWGESHATSGAGEETCMGRKANFDSFCGTKSARMLWKSQDTVYQAPQYEDGGVLKKKKRAPRLPIDGGCYMWMPHGCPYHKLETQNNWNKDYWGNDHGAKDSTEKCLARKSQIDSYCGTTDAVMMRVASSSKGAMGYAQRLPAPEASEELDFETVDDEFERLQEMMAETSETPPAPWTLVAKDELAQADAPDAEGLKLARRGRLLHEVPPEDTPALPDSAGCFVWLPSGCKGTAHFNAKVHWSRDTWGEENMRAAELPDACKARKNDFDNFCQVTDTIMLPIVAAPGQPVPAAQQEQVQASVKPEPEAQERDQRSDISSTAAPETEDDTALDAALSKLEDHPQEEAAAARSEDDTALDAALSKLEEGAAQADAVEKGPAARAPAQARVARSPVTEAAAPEQEREMHQNTEDLELPMELLPEAAPAFPKSTGCFVWTPSGCRSEARFDAKRHWRRDLWGEAHRDAANSTAACKARKRAFDKWCRVVDSVMLHVGLSLDDESAETKEERDMPTAAAENDGSTTTTPDQIPSVKLYKTKAAVHENFTGLSAERYAVSKAPKAASAQNSKGGKAELLAASKEQPKEAPRGKQWWDIVAGNSSHKMPAPPRETGCYALLPSACDNQQVELGQWKKVKQRRETKYKRPACAGHKNFYDLWCGVTDAVMAWVAPSKESKAIEAWRALTAAGAVQPPLPESPGCYILYPSGCPKKSSMDPQTRWVRYHHSQESEVTLDKDQCMKLQEKQNKFCGVSDISMGFV